MSNLFAPNQMAAASGYFMPNNNPVAPAPPPSVRPKPAAPTPPTAAVPDKDKPKEKPSSKGSYADYKNEFIYMFMPRLEDNFFERNSKGELGNPRNDPEQVHMTNTRIARKRLEQQYLYQGAYILVIVSLLIIIALLGYFYYELNNRDFVSYIDRSASRKHMSRIVGLLPNYYPRYTRLHTEG